jgi:hypothetical protein
LFTDAPEFLGDVLGANAERRRRTVGVVSSASSAANAHFVIRFNESHTEQVTRTVNSGSTYDAFYLLAYAVNAVGGGASGGVAIARAFERLRPPGLLVEVGPTDALVALSELARGGSIDLEGASSSLDMDIRTGEVALDYVLECAAVDPAGRARNASVESQLTYKAASRKVTGSLACP